MLVVITIVAVLAAMISPALAGVREKARRAKCASNIHQIGEAQLLFANDHDGWFWFFNPDYVNYVGGGGWPMSLPEYFDQNGFSNYLKIVDVLYCPSRLARPHTANNPLSCQIISPWGQQHNSLRHYCPMMGLSAMHDARYILMYERVQYFNWGFIGGAGGAATASEWNELWPAGSLTSDSNHGTAGSNILYVDGRVAWKSGDIGPFYGSRLYPPELAAVFYGPPYCFFVN
ncbi:MAG: hypothetical protein JO317_05125 [Verrucomicrobiae bacterium]|nr:hypothetical protein [Verrucomicrobiae bacterium]